MWEILAELLPDPVGIIRGVWDWRRERGARRRAQASMIPCALRVVDGTQFGLSRRWRRGAARVPPGVLVFEPASSQRRLTIPVRAATLHPHDAPPGRRFRRMGATRRITVETSAATLEWLVPQGQLHRSMGVARAPDPVSRPNPLPP